MKPSQCVENSAKEKKMPYVIELKCPDCEDKCVEACPLECIRLTAALSSETEPRLYVD